MKGSTNTPVSPVTTPVFQSFTPIRHTYPSSNAEMGDNNNQSVAYPTLPYMDEYNRDWTHDMRQSMQEIIPGLFLGPYAAASRKKLQDMKNAGLTHVVCVRAEVEAHIIRPNFPNDFQYLALIMNDSPLETVIPKVKQASEFIDACLSTGGKVLVHGNAGMTRSAILVIGYIMSKFGVTFKKAEAFVRHKRFCLAIREALGQQLTEYEPIYMAMNSAAAPGIPGLSGGDYQRLKRSIDEIADSVSSSPLRPRMDTPANQMDTD